MAERLKQSLSIRQRFYKMSALLLSVFLMIMSIGIFTVLREQDQLNQRFESNTLKYDSINNLAESVNQVFFRARGYYAFQDQRELELLYENLDQVDDDLATFASLSLNETEESLHETLSEFFANYRQNILPQALGFVREDDYESLRALASGGTNQIVNEFIDYTNEFREANQEQRDQIYADSMALIDVFTTGFIFLGIASFLLFVVVIGSMLKDIIRPLNNLIVATDNLKDGHKAYLEEDYQLKELSTLANSFNAMALEVNEKEEELTAQNEELIAQHEALEENQDQLQKQLIEIEHINKALDQSALMCITDPKGIMLKVNEMFCQVSQYTPEELVDTPIRILKSGHHSPEFYDKLWQTITKGKIWTGEIKNEAKDGSAYWLDLTIVPFLDKHGKPYRYILIGIDVSENKQYELELRDLLEETQTAKEKTERYSNLNKVLTATVERKEFLNQVFGYFKDTFAFDKGILVSMEQKEYEMKGLCSVRVQQFLTDTYNQDIIERLKKESIFRIKRSTQAHELGIAEEEVFAYDLYASIGNPDQVDLVLALTRIGHDFTPEEMHDISVLMGQLGVASSRIDIYEAVQHERSLNESIVQNVTEGLQLVNLNGDLVQSNEKLLELIDIDTYRSRKVIEQEQWISDFTERCIDQTKTEAFFRKAIGKDYTAISSIRCQMNDEEARHMQIYTSPVFIKGEKTGTIFMYRDITKEFEVDAMKSELVSTVSHELRTPLSSVLGFTEMLLMKDLKPEKQKRYLETIYKEARRLTNLINDFLDIQRIESGKQQYHMSDINLNEVIMEVIDTFKHGENHLIYLEDSAAHTKVHADKDRMVQLLTNLISNAVKFSPAGGKVSLRIKNKADQLIVSIKDQGIGIPEADLDNMFTKFKRVDNSSSKKIGGTGLGLAISKGIVKAHEGDIWIKSKENGGTTVSFSLPLIQETKEGRQTYSLDDTDQVFKGSVLLVEDDISLATMLSESLKSNGFNVIHYLSSQNVTDIAAEQPLVGIVVDLVLEDGHTGWNLIRAIRENADTKDIPIVISSAIDKSMKKIEEFGVHDYLVKPYSPSILSNIMLELA